MPAVAGSVTVTHGEASETGFALKARIQLHRMADGSGVLADAEGGEAHALNPEGAALLASAEPWTEQQLCERMQARGVSHAEATIRSRRFIVQLLEIGAIEPTRA